MEVLSALSIFTWSWWSRTSGDTELKQLRKEVQHSIEYNIDHRQFFPAGLIHKLATPNRIGAVLSRSVSDPLVVFVTQHAKKMFLALVCGEACSASGLEFIMQSCQDHGMTDDKLPVKMMSCMGCGEDNARSCFPGHRDEPWLNVFHDSRWKNIKFRFCNDQCTINPPVFFDHKFRYDLPAECVLPFTSKGTVELDGHFSVISEVVLNQDHFIIEPEEWQGDNTQLKRVATREPLRVALKKMKHPDDERGDDVENAWEHKVSALNEIHDLRHAHLVRPLAAIKHGSNYYTMFEWADAGSLRDVWKSVSYGTPLTPERVMCVLEELRGIAGALEALQGTNPITRTGLAVRTASLLSAPVSDPPLVVNRRLEPPQPQTLQVPTIRVQQDSSDDESLMSSDLDQSYASSEDTDVESEVHWRHGDLKPDNILRFQDPSSEKWLGTLKIGDLGLAKHHFDKTSRRNGRTGQRYTTSQYEAPEAMTGLNSPRSRRYDIWSMGCIILEFVIVLMYGPDGLVKFYSETSGKSGRASTDTLYFTLDVDNGTADVSHIVQHWIREILRDPECSRPEGGAISDLIKLVRDRLLVVGLPEEGMTEKEIMGCRADAGELRGRLEKIYRLALDRGDEYLLAQPRRFYSQVPPLSRTPLGRMFKAISPPPETPTSDDS